MREILENDSIQPRHRSICNPLFAFGVARTQKQCYLRRQTAAKPSVWWRCGHGRTRRLPDSPPLHRLAASGTFELGQQFARIQRLKIAVGLGEGFGNGLVFLRQHAAGGIDQAPTRLGRRAALSRMAVCLRPPGFSAWGDWRHLRSGCGAGCPGRNRGIDQHAVDLAARRLTRSSRSCAMATGCTLDSPLRASRA